MIQNKEKEDGHYLAVKELLALLRLQKLFSFFGKKKQT